MRNIRLLLFLLLIIIFPATLAAGNGQFFKHGLMSSSLANKICQDAYGYIWVGTEYGLNKFDGYRFTPYLHHEGDTTSIQSNIITAFAVGRDKTLWIGSNKGLSRYDYATNTFVNYRFPSGLQPRISTLTFDHDGTLLIGTAGYGLYKLSGKQPEIDTRYYRKDMNGYYSRMTIDNRGNLWCTSNEPGIVRIAPATGSGRPQRRAFASPFGSTVAIFAANNGVTAVCNGGIATFDHRSQQFVNAGYDISVLDGTYIEHAYNFGGDIYVSTQGWGIGIIAKGTRTLHPIYATLRDIDTRSAHTSDLCRDRDGNIWMSCYRQGVLLVTTATTAFGDWNFAAQGILTKGTLQGIATYGDDVLCAVPPVGIYRISSDGRSLGLMNSPASTRTIHRDRLGNYWLGVGSSLYWYDPATQQAKEVMRTDGQAINCMADADGVLYFNSLGKGFYAYNPITHATTRHSMNDVDKQRGVLTNDWIMDMAVNAQGQLWICTTDGVSCFDSRTASFRSEGWETLLKGKTCQAVAFMDNGNTVIGTSAGLWLYDKKQRKAARFPKSEPLNDKGISSIVVDKSGDLWVSTMDGIWQWEHKSGSFIGHISGNGLTAKEYWPHLAFHTADDRIGFGTPDGITVFRPADVRRNNAYRGEIHLTNVVIGGKVMGTMSDTYSVANDEKTVSMEFSLLNYSYSGNVIFQYRLDNGQWATTDNYSNAVAFTRLPYGDHILEVRAMSNGKAIAPVKRITVSVAPPWYLTNEAFLIYAMLVIIAIAAAVIYYGQRKQRELEEAKMRFLINATHDIRSPLTLIMGPLRKLRDRITDPESQRDLETIERNAGRLQTLVGQILDKRRIDKQQLHLHCRKTDLVQFTASIVSLFRYNAEERGIELTYSHPDNAEVWIDRTHFDKVVANILSNAFKYTPDGGAIAVCISMTDKTVTLTVTDSGQGFGDTNLKHVFDRFYQGDNSRTLHTGGTGIGLNLCHALTKMHGGSITAANRSDGQTGAILTVTLPTGNAHLKPEQIEKEDEKQQAETRQKQANRNIRLMVVDDDNEVAAYIKEELADWYRTETFPNGKVALEALLKGKYDVVVSDVMMPVMDGIELLRAIKGNSNVSDVPVIMLTSKAEVADRLEGLRRGADAYLSKPFNMDELHATIDNVVDNVRRLRGKFSGAQSGGGRVEDVEVKGNDDTLMERVMKSVNKNMDDSDFSVEQLCQDVGISRTQLHRKMKEITGVSTSEFIRNLRLEQAARLLREGKINVTQVAYAVGFNNSAHFSTVFKKHFGMSPSEYSEKNKDAGEE